MDYRTSFGKVLRVLQGNVSSIQMVMASALVVGCATASVTLWYFSRRYVGELSLLKGSFERPSRLCFSVLDFWGNREVCTRLLFSAYTKTTCLHSVFQHVNAITARCRSWRPAQEILIKSGHCQALTSNVMGTFHWSADIRLGSICSYHSYDCIPCVAC